MGKSHDGRAPTRVTSLEATPRRQSSIGSVSGAEIRAAALSGFRHPTVNDRVLVAVEVLVLEDVAGRQPRRSER